jgi:methionyl-tRNA formyltransferase
VSRIRAVFLGTPEIARTYLEAMIKDEHFEVVGVVSQPDRPAGRKLQLTPSPVKSLVLPLGIPVITPESVNTDEAMATVVSWRAEVAVVVAFGQMLSKKFLDLFPNRVVNVHASLLPRWRGAAPVQRALMAGDEESGVSMQIVVRKMDAGPLLGSRKFALTPEMNATDVFAKVSAFGSELISIELMDYLRGNLSPNLQDESLVTLAPKIMKEESWIDWSWPAERIHNLVRGLAAGPVASTLRAGKTVKIRATRMVLNGAGGKPGQLRASGSTGLHVVCGQGVLEILKLQPESRAAMTAAEYLRGYPIQQGDSFGSNESVSRRS